MNGKMYRLREFIRTEDDRSLILDASAGLSLGALPGLENFEKATRPLLQIIDGLVCSHGQLRRIEKRTRTEAGLLVRMDWNNTLRPTDFVLPPTAAHLVPVLTPQDALDLGAVAMVSTFLLGYEEEIEAASLRNTVQLAMQGNEIGMPLVVEVYASGPRVSLPDKAIELGASYALEGGAEAIVLPRPGRKSLNTIASFVSVPWLIRVDHAEEAGIILDEVLESGGAGIWLSHRVFALTDAVETLKRLAGHLHSPVAA